MRFAALLGVAAGLATVLPGWWMLLVALPIAGAVLDVHELPRRGRRSAQPATDARRSAPAPLLTTDDRVRSGGDWLAWLAAGLDVARASDARRQALARVEARHAELGLGDGPADADEPRGATE